VNSVPSIAGSMPVFTSISEDTRLSNALWIILYNESRHYNSISSSSEC
jgi:hypothetical protein